MRRITTLLIVGLIVGTLVLAGVGVAYLGGYFDRIPFDSATWKGEEPANCCAPGPRTIRQRMVNDLLRRHNLVGMRRAEVEALLGARPRYADESVYEYALGPYTDWFETDCEVLHIDFRQDFVIAVHVGH
jgi:hypothetical protein